MCVMRRLCHRLTKRKWSLSLIVRAFLSCALYSYFLILTKFVCVALRTLEKFISDRDEFARVAHVISRKLAYHNIQVNPGWRCEFEGLDNLDLTRTYVFVANHQSMTDIGVLASLPVHYKWIAKIQIFRMPGVGELMRINRYIAVGHGDMKSVRRMMKDGRQSLADGVSLFIFPEGRRSLDGELCEFKRGPFRLACETNTLVLPVVIDGTRKVLSTGEWILDFNATIKVSILPPLSPGDFDNNPNSLCAAAKQAMRVKLAKLRNHELPAASPVESKRVANATSGNR